MHDPDEPRPCCRAKRARKCLMCGEAFGSDGPHNRICPRCKISRRWREGETAYTEHTGRRRS